MSRGTRARRQTAATTAAGNLQGQRRPRPFDAATRDKLLARGDDLPPAMRDPVKRSESQHVLRCLADDAGEIRAPVRKWLADNAAHMPYLQREFVAAYEHKWPTSLSKETLENVVQQTLTGAPTRPYSLPKTLQRLSKLSFEELCARFAPRAQFARAIV